MNGDARDIIEAALRDGDLVRGEEHAFQLRERDRMHATLMHENTKQLVAMRKERDLLRSLVGDRLEERGIAVMPADVADVVRWAKNAQHVRALMKDPPADRNGECPNGCYGDPYTPHDRDCPIVAAWHALGDPRAVQDVDNANEVALQENRERAMTREEMVAHYAQPLLSAVPAERLQQVERLVREARITQEQGNALLAIR